MNITLNIDEKLFDESGVGEAIKDAFINMPQEEKSAIMKDILKQYLSDSNFIKNYFIKKENRIWSSNYAVQDVPTDEFKELIRKIDFNDEMEDVKKVFIEVINKDLNKFLLKLLVDSYMNSIASMVTNNDNFRSDISNNILTEFNRLMNSREQ